MLCRLYVYPAESLLMTAGALSIEGENCEYPVTTLYIYICRVMQDRYTYICIVMYL